MHTSVDVSTTQSPSDPVSAPSGAVAAHTRRSLSAPVFVGVLSAVSLSTVFLLLPVSGTDLAAAVAHGAFARQHPLVPVDLNWYGGANELGYSLLSQYLVAVLGARLTGALAASVTVVALGWLFARVRARYSAVATAVAAFCVFGNLVSGRIAYAVGVAFGVLACCAVAGRRPRWATAAAFLCAAASPVAGLFLGVCAAGLWLCGRRREGVLLCAGLAVPMLVTGVLFGQGGQNTISRMDTLHALVPLVAVGVLATTRLVRVTTALVLATVVAVFFVPNPVGLSVSRLGITFAIPVMLAFSRRRLALVLPVCLLVLQFSSPISTRDLRLGGDVTADKQFFAPLLEQLESRPLTGRVEIPPLFNYWESAYVADKVPLARGWLRQLDTLRNPIFFRNDRIPAAEYRQWLTDNAVQYVAVADQRASWVGRREVALVTSRPPFLRPVWSNHDWTLYAVESATSLVDAPASVVSAEADAIELTVPAKGDYLLRVPWNRWLTLDGAGGCIVEHDARVELRVREPGTFRLTSSLLPGRGC